MNKHVNRSISHPTPFVKTCNEKLKWDMDVYVRTCRYDMYEYTHVVFFLLGCYIMKLHEVRIMKVLVV
jgi:hypothetical protein